MTDFLARPAFYRIYFGPEIDTSDVPDGLRFEEYEARTDAILDRLFGAADPALRQRLLPEMIAPEVFDDEDRAAARKVMGFATDSDKEPPREVLAVMAARRRLPPNVVVELRLPADYTWRVTFDPAPAIHHELAHPELPEPLELGYRDPHFKLPILRWTEVDALAAHLAPRERPLLLSTAWRGAADDLAAPAAIATGILREAHVLSAAAIEELVVRLLVPVEIAWRRHPTLGWVNDGEHSVRNPENEDLTPDEFARLAAFFRAAGAA
jgi:hypothetical protein